MPATDELLRNNKAYAAAFPNANLPTPPAKRLAVVACMDSRLDVFAALGLRVGEAHVIRNAGGIVTDDVIRSLLISQRLLHTEEIVLVHHTDCGLLKFREEELHEQIAAEVGARPPFALGAIDDLEASVRESIDRIRRSPFVPRSDQVRGFIFDVETGALREIQ